MTPEDMIRARELFFLALDKTPDERTRFLEELRLQHASLARFVEDLLSAHHKRGPLDQRPLPQGPTLTYPVSTTASVADPGNPTVLGDYELIGRIAAGGIGVVYRARQISLNRIVAVKVLRSGRLATDKEVERFRAEAEAVALLDHANIVPVYEVGQFEDQHYFSMKLIDGPSLASRIERFRADPPAAVSLLATVAGAVHHAHQRGILHRDLKPSNILLDEQELPYVADFGIAQTSGPGRRPDPDRGHVRDAGLHGARTDHGRRRSHGQE